MQQNNEGGTIDYEVDVIAPLPLVMQDGTYSYVYGLDLISAVDGSANELYYLYDGLGSVAALTDDSGVETDSYVYDAFGAVTSSTGTTSNDWLFTGEQRDGDTELYFLRARYYDPETGRFLGRDPLEFAQRYAYAGNNPVAYTDPSGLEYESSIDYCYFLGWGGDLSAYQVAYNRSHPDANWLTLGAGCVEPDPPPLVQKGIDYATDPWLVANAAQTGVVLVCKSAKDPRVIAACIAGFSAIEFVKAGALQDEVEEGRTTSCEAGRRQIIGLLPFGGIDKQIAKWIAEHGTCPSSE